MASFGEELRRERELRQISLREVAEATKINLRYLEAMESNDFVGLPGGVFNRGFVRAYCQFIGVDPETMVNAYLLQERTQVADHKGSEPGLLRRPRPSGGTRRIVVAGPALPRGSLLKWLAIVLVLAALAGGALLYLELARRSRISAQPTLTPGHPRVALADGVVEGVL